jgi:hypothetical protein
MTLIIPHDLRRGLVDDKPVEKAACYAAKNGSQPKEP